MRIGTVTMLTSLSILACIELSWAEDLGHAGTFITVQGTVVMQPATLTSPRPVRPYDEIGPLAVIETKSASRAKILFDDDTLIAMGERSRFAMTEQTYQAGSDSRAFVAHLTRGKARALVGRSFKGDNSIFELHSRSAVASVRGTYFVMWVEEVPRLPATKDRKGEPRIPFVDEATEEGATGVANIGTSGDITFTSGGATVLVLPGQSSIALPGSPPSMPVAIDTETVETGPIAAALAGTVVPDIPRPESPRAALAAAGMGETGWSASSAATTAKAGAPGGQFPSGGYAIPGWPIPVTPVTPPAVVSGAAGTPNPIGSSITLP
jgi:hypothetical protein